MLQSNTLDTMWLLLLFSLWEDPFPHEHKLSFSLKPSSESNWYQICLFCIKTVSYRGRTNKLFPIINIYVWQIFISVYFQLLLSINNASSNYKVPDDIITRSNMQIWFQPLIVHHASSNKATYCYKINIANTNATPWTEIDYHNGSQQNWFMKKGNKIAVWSES